VPCLGRQAGTVDWGGTARWHGGPYRAVPYRAVPGTGLGRAVPGGPNAHFHAGFVPDFAWSGTLCSWASLVPTAFAS